MAEKSEKNGTTRAHDLEERLRANGFVEDADGFFCRPEAGGRPLFESQTAIPTKVVRPPVQACYPIDCLQQTPDEMLPCPPELAGKVPQIIQLAQELFKDAGLSREADGGLCMPSEVDPTSEVASRLVDAIINEMTWKLREEVQLNWDNVTFKITWQQRKIVKFLLVF